MTEIRLSEDAIRKVTHDLRGPVVNMRGFVDELGMAVTDLIALVEHHRGGLSEEFSCALLEIVNEDLSPCLKFLGQAALQFEQRIDEVPQMIDADLQEHSEVEA